MHPPLLQLIVIVELVLIPKLGFSHLYGQTHQILMLADLPTLAVSLFQPWLTLAISLLQPWLTLATDIQPNLNAAQSQGELHVL